MISVIENTLFTLLHNAKIVYPRYIPISFYHSPFEVLDSRTDHSKE